MTDKNAEMTNTLKEAGTKAVTEKKERQMRVVKGAHLKDKMIESATAAGLTSEEKSGFLKFSAGVKGKNLYLARKGGRVDLSGFTAEATAIKQISEKEAQEKHLGKVRGTIDFEQADDVVLAAFTAAIEAVKVPNPEPVKPPKAPKAPKAEKPADASAPPTTSDVVTSAPATA